MTFNDKITTSTSNIDVVRDEYDEVILAYLWKVELKENTNNDTQETK